MVFSNNLLAGAGGQATGYEIEQSIRFNEDDSAHLARTPSSASNRNTHTFSAWVKRGRMTSHGTFFAAGAHSNDYSFMSFVNDEIHVADWNAGYNWRLYSNTVLRDPSAWYHIVVRYDDTQSTASSRVKIYLNSVQVTDFHTETYPSQNYGYTEFNNTVEHTIGEQTGGSGANDLLDAYMAEIHFIDGTALDPTSFGETNSDSGQWVPIEYSGSYGTNGFYLKGQDSSALGDDSSGNNNDYASSGLTTADQVNDSPTNNFATFNPIGSCTLVSGQALTISDGNLRSSASGTTNAIEAVGTIAPTTGKYYAEFTLNAAPQLSNQYPAIGVIGIDVDMDGGNNLGNSSFFGYLPNGNKLTGGSSSSYGNTYGNGDIIGIALDLDNQKIYFSKNGTYQNSGDPAAGSNAAFTNLVAGTQYRFCVSHAGSSATDVTMNAGQLAFNTAAPTGFSSMSTANLPNPAIADPSQYFQSTLYTGNGSTQSISQSGNLSTFQPDWVWIKNRSAADSHVLTDAVRGATKIISSDATSAESTDADTLTAFESDGFALGDDDKVNTSSENFVAWQWKANGSGSSNTDGTINTTATSVNTTAGFSISTYTGTGSNATVGHGLGVAPDVILVKERTSGSVENWEGFFSAIGPTKTLSLNKNAAEQTSSTRWNDTSPTSSVFSIGTATAVNDSSGQYVAYCFAEVEGYSKISSFKGNGNADGPFVNTGFAPAVIIWKNADTAGNHWVIADRARSPHNVSVERLFPDLNSAESTSTAMCDFLSNGFKIRSTMGEINTSGNDIVYIAFAESPFKTATAR